MLNNKRYSIKKICYISMGLLFMLFYTIMETINLYIQYMTIIYLNKSEFNKTYIVLINLLIVHHIIKFCVACIKFGDCYTQCKKKDKIY